MEERLQLGCSSKEDRGYNVDQSSKKKRKEEEKTNGDDLISCLPESLILAIISFLSMEDATRFGFASKKFFSVCKSMPVLDFDYFSFKKNSNISDPTQVSSFFLDFVAKSLELRNISNNINDACFQRLSFVGPITDDLFTKIVDFSLNKKIKELNINGDLDKRNPLCILPNTIFSAQHFTGLKIKGFHLNLEDQNFVLSCPLIEKINLSRCSGFKTITLFGDKLKHVELDSCIELVKINIDPQVSLESFSYSALYEKLRKQSCELVFDLDSFKLLKFLEFKCTDIITDEWFQDHVSHMNLLESLKLDTCLMLKTIRMDSDNLKILVLRRCKGLEHIEIIAPNLESFQFEIMEEKKHCKVINISCSKYLKSLKLRGATVTDEWIEDNLSRFLFLEHLELKECNSLKKIEFCGGKLRSLKLLMCMSLSILEIDAPSLVSFVYNGDLLSSPPVLNSNSRLHATLFLSNTPSYITESYRRYFRDFIGSFDHCKTLFLADISTKVLIYPEDVRDIMIPPLYDLKHLKVQAKWYKTQCVVQLVEGLLWLVPNPETISIILHDQDLKVVKSLSLKFHCKPAVKEDDVSCCASSPIKCWRHFLVEVEMDNFGDSYERSNLQNFLMNNAKGLTHVICTR